MSFLNSALGSLSDDHPNLAFGLGIATVGADIFRTVTARNSQNNGLLPQQVAQQQAAAVKAAQTQTTKRIAMYIAIAFLAILGVVVVMKE